jgi:DNA helicase IV
MPDFWFNIEGCLSKYQDMRTTEIWLTRACTEMSTSDFTKLVNRLLVWLIANPNFNNLAEDIFQLLNKYDPVGDIYRRSYYDQERRQALAKEELRKAQEKEKQERNRREEQRREKERQEAEEQRKREHAFKARKTSLLDRIKDSFESDFLGADKIYKTDLDSNLIDDYQYAEIKRDFVKDWVLRELQLTLDLEQASAVAAIDGDIKVTARAGSGKTRTLVTRAIFLQKHCRVAPHKLLLLAFNSTAADEMKERLTKSIEGPLPHVLNFHKLAHALVHPEEGLLFDDTNTDQLSLSREIQEVIDKHLMSKEYGPRIKELMLAYFRDDWERIVNGGFQLTMDEFLAHRRQLPRETLKGDYVKSFGEKLIANILFENEVVYRYERNFRWDGFNYRPDFTIGSKGGVIIEYFGLLGDADYDDLADKKRAFWAKRSEWKFLEFTPMDITQNGSEAFTEKLIGKLRKAGVICNPLSDEETWQRVKKRAVDSFTKAMRTFISRCRKLNLSPDNIKAMVDAHRPCSTAERLFLDVGVSVHQGYMERLIEIQKEDFDGLMWRAVALLRDGQTRFVRDKGHERGDIRDLRFIMIDEFQDFSQMFFELVNAIRLANPAAQFFCVGDDWQAINAFAGSDLEFFKEFTRYFRSTSQYDVRTNYRSPQNVVAISNALMKGLGVPAQADLTDCGWVRLCELDGFKPSAPEQERHNGDDITPALLRVVRSLLDRGFDIVMLSRRSSIPWYVNYTGMEGHGVNALLRFLEHVRTYLPKDDRGRITVSTTHKYKGLERDAVIVLDAKARSYPLIHPHWFFLRIFDNSIEKIEQEERRLFYVAITRAQNSLSLFTETRDRSPYLNDIQKHIAIDSLTWEDLPPVPSLESPRLEIRVFNAFNVKDQLKDLKYDWDEPEKFWYRVVMAEGFSFEALLEQPWARSDVRIEVYSETSELLYQR